MPEITFESSLGSYAVARWEDGTRHYMVWIYLWTDEIAAPPFTRSHSPAICVTSKLTGKNSIRRLNVGANSHIKDEIERLIAGGALDPFKEEANKEHAKRRAEQVARQEQERLAEIEKMHAMAARHGYTISKDNTP